MFFKDTKRPTNNSTKGILYFLGYPLNFFMFDTIGTK